MRLPWLTTPTLRRWARHFPVPTSFDRHANRLQRPAMNQSVLTINGLDISLGAAIAAFTVAVLALLVTIAIIAARAFRQRARGTAGQMRRSQAMESRIAENARIQAETAGRLQALGEGLGGRQAALSRVMSERADAASPPPGRSPVAGTPQTC